MASKAEVVKRTLQLLGVLHMGQSASSENTARINLAYTEVYNDLKKESLAVWAISGPIPDEIDPHLVYLMAFNAVDEFGVSNARYQRIVARIPSSKREIRKLTIPDYESLEEPEEF